MATTSQPGRTGRATPVKIGGRRGILVLAALALGIGWLLSLHTGQSTTAKPHKSSSVPAAVAMPMPSPTPSSVVTWQNFAGLQLPVSTTAGPNCLTVTRAACFADSDAGAALAAVHLLVRTFPFAGSATFAPTISQQVTGPDKPAFARLTLQAYDAVAKSGGVRHGAAITSDGGSVAGYRFDDAPGIGGNLATVHVLIFQNLGEESHVFVDFTVHLAWQNDDWRLIAPAWGDWQKSASSMTTADPSQYRSYDDLGQAGRS